MDVSLQSCRWFITRVVFACALLCSEVAAAQTCHSPALRDREHDTWRASLAAVVASYRNAQEHGDYQGAQLLAAFMHPIVSVSGGMSYYRLADQGSVAYGPGDAVGTVRVSAFATEDGTLSLGPELAATFPTGDAQQRIGMGHVMLMPGVWLAMAHARFSLSAQLAYGRALVAHGTANAPESGHEHHAHHAQEGSLVNPMNQSELEHALAARLTLYRELSATGRWLGALPVAASDGKVRQVLAGGLQLVVRRWDVNLELQVPVLGDPFTLRGSLTFGVQW